MDSGRIYESKEEKTSFEIEPQADNPAVLDNEQILKSEKAHPSPLAFDLYVRDDIAARDLLLVEYPNLDAEDKEIFDLFKKLVAAPTLENFKLLDQTHTKLFERGWREGYFYLSRCYLYGLGISADSSMQRLMNEIYCNNYVKSKTWDSLLNYRDVCLLHGVALIGWQRRIAGTPEANSWLFFDGLNFLRKAAVNEVLLTLQTNLPATILLEAQTKLAMLEKRKSITPDDLTDLRSEYANKNYNQVTQILCRFGFSYLDIVEILNFTPNLNDPSHIATYSYLYYLKGKYDIDSLRTHPKGETLSVFATHVPHEFVMYWLEEPNKTQQQIMAHLNLSAKWALFQYTKKLILTSPLENCILQETLLPIMQEVHLISIMLDYRGDAPITLISHEDLETSVQTYVKSCYEMLIEKSRSPLGFFRIPDLASNSFNRETNDVEKYYAFREAIWANRINNQVESIGELGYLNRALITLLANQILIHFDRFKKQHGDIKNVMNNWEVILFNEMYITAEKFKKPQAKFKMPILHPLVVTVMSCMELIENQGIKQIWFDTLKMLKEKIKELHKRDVASLDAPSHLGDWDYSANKCCIQ